MNTSHRNQDDLLEGGQKVDLIPTIQGLTRAYPGGLGIVKELLQNADDAEARTVQITLDWGTHSIDDLPEPNMVEFLQPALLIFNDAAFKEKDFTAIKNIYKSSKQKDLTKAGRFGRGFNSVYHLTDYPSFASLDRVLFFDPHTTVFQSGGKGWWFEDSKIKEFLNLYKSGLPSGLPQEYSLENSTIFRLPFRVKPQNKDDSISNEIFDRDAIQKFRDELLNISEELLLFLKSVDEIRVCEIVDREVCKLLRVTTKNKKEVFAERHKLISLLQSGTSSSLSASYLQEIETQNQEETFTSTWRVCNVIRYEEQEIQEGIAFMDQYKEKAVPWAGVAAKIKTSPTNIKIKPFEGKAYCFLPLNFATGLPVHIHGFFDLDDARTDLTRQADHTDQKRNVRAEWNLLLVKHVLAHAYVNLIKSLVEDVGEQDPHRFYRFFPISSSNPTLEDLPKFVIEQLQSHRVIRSAIAHPFMNQGQDVDSRWVEPTMIKVLLKRYGDLLEPLRLEKIDLPDPPLPSEIEKVFKDAGKPFATFQPSDLRSQLETRQPLGMPLEQAPRLCLRKKEWVIGLLKYCLSDQPRDVSGLPLAILADGTLQSFGYSTAGFIYITPPDAYEILQEQIFADFPDWFLDDDLIAPVRDSDIKNFNGITSLMPVEVAKRLKALLSPDGSTPVEWQPDGQAIPNADWLTSVYQYLKTLDRFYPEVNQIPLVPCRDGLLYVGGNDATPLWHGTKEPTREILEMLEYFGVRLFAAQGELQDAIADFRNRRRDQIMIDMLSVPKVIDKLAELPSLPVDNRRVFELVNYLCIKPIWINDEESKTKLRQLAIYPTISGELTDINERVFISTDYTFPKITGQLKLLRLGASETNQDWKISYEYLGVKPLNDATMLRNLLSDYGNLSNVEQVEALEWIKNNLDIAESQEKKSNPNSTLKKEVKEARLILCIDGQLRAANTIYHPKVYETVKQILGESIYSPDMAVYKNQDDWFAFFQKLGMQTKPSPNDLLLYVDDQIQKAKDELTQQISDSLLNIFNYLASDWEDLSKKDAFVQLVKELNKRAWLPPEVSPEKLKQFVGYKIPENKLYRSNEIYLTNLGYGYLLASQKPLLTIKGSMPKGFSSSDFGFDYPDPVLVVNHFKKLIDLWILGSGNGINNDDFEKSIKSIYRYLYKQFVGKDKDPRKQQWLREQFNDYKCLWDLGRFWLPKHTFQCNLPYFGERRRSLVPEYREFCEVYELLGQKKFPEIEDYVDFMAELADHCKGNALSEVDAKCAYEVLYLLTKELEKEQLSALDYYDLLLLTEDNLLLPPVQILIPDAPWRIDAVRDRDVAKILHPLVPHSLAIDLGSRSLAKHVDEVTQEITSSSDPQANEICRKWQSLMRSPEFIMGLKRLILDQHEKVQVDLDWLSKVSVQAAAMISTNLMLDQDCIASGVEGSYYFKQDDLVFHLRQEDSENLMQDYLTESLNQQIQDLKLSDTKRLFMLLSSKYSEIEKLLDRLKVKPLPPSLILELPDAHEPAAPDEIFGDDPLEDLDNLETEEAVTESINETTDIPKSDPLSSEPAVKPTVPKPIPSNNNNPAPNLATVSPIIKPAQSPAPTTIPSIIVDVKSTSEGNGENTPQTSEASSVAESSTAERMPSISPTQIPRKPSGGRRIKFQYRNGVRVRSGLEVDPQKSVEEIPESEARKIDTAGMTKVMAYERDHERDPQDMNDIAPNHPGYDVKSTDRKTGKVRYIEVKSLRSKWTKRGVCMSSTQFEEGKLQEKDFWLYVVEEAETDAAKVITIQDPVGWVGEYYYDDSWRQLASDEATD